MGREMLMACLPWALLLLGCIIALCLIARLNHARLAPRRLLALHADQHGGAQSLSFVLTLPIFIMLLLFIVQVGQLMIGQIAVEYAAFAAARAAAVWIPADLPGMEGANCISSFAFDPQAANQDIPEIDPNAADYGPSPGGVYYIVASGSPKYEKIASAAVLGVMPVCPSRDLGFGSQTQWPTAAAALQSLYTSMAPSAATQPAAMRRIENKLAYALANTSVEIRFYHPNSEPPLQLTYFLPEDPDEFRFNELGWQDQVTVTVRHNLAMLPGPGRLLAKYGLGITGRSGSDVYADVYTYPLSAKATIGIEGEKPVIPYVRQ
jgi:hypothetical protein